MPSSSAPIRADLAHAQHTRRLRRQRWVVGVLTAVVLSTTLAAVWSWRFAFADLPAIPEKSQLWSLNRPPGITFLDREGRTVGQRGPRHGQTVGVGELPDFVPRAFLAVEDRRFYDHPGIDLIGVARAARADLTAGKVVQGGSTITQQLVKNLFLSPDQSFRRKAQEAALAWKLERRLSKNEVLELYLNRIYFGDGAYGLEAAAQTYFGVSARKLNLAQAALLAALPKAPTRLDPTNDLEAAQARSQLVLGAMRQEGWITPAQQNEALTHPPTLAAEQPLEGDFGYALDLAQAQARTLAGGRAPDLIVHLTVDAPLQAEAGRTLREGVGEGRALGATQGAMVALAPDGAIRALVGGVDHRRSPFDRATQAMRQPGSAFKAFVYAAGMERGLGPETIRTDGPVRIGRYAPQNAGGGYAGPVTLQTAFEQSINTVAVRVTNEVKPRAVAELARRFGLGEITPKPLLPIALGAYEVSLLHLTAAYQVFQQGGRRRDPYLVSRISNAHGDLLYVHPVSVEGESVYDRARAGSMVAMMQGVIAHGTGRRADFGRPAAGKTGTSQNYRDAWFIGFTPDWVAGVWIGDDRGRSMRGMHGGDLPAAIWRRFMTTAHAGLPPRPFELPQAVFDPAPEEPRPIDARTGEAADTRPRQTVRIYPEPRYRDPEDLPQAPPLPRRIERRDDFYENLYEDLDRAAEGERP